MSRFYAVSMASEVVQHPLIAKEKSFLGLRTKVVYTPTQSVVESFENTYDTASGVFYQKLLQMSHEELSAVSDFKYNDGDDFLMEICLSEDHEFLAVRLSKSQLDEKEPVTPIVFYTGEDAVKIQSLL